MFSLENKIVFLGLIQNLKILIKFSSISSALFSSYINGASDILQLLLSGKQDCLSSMYFGNKTFTGRDSCGHDYLHCHHFCNNLLLFSLITSPHRVSHHHQKKSGECYSSALLKCFQHLPHRLVIQEGLAPPMSSHNKDKYPLIRILRPSGNSPLKQYGNNTAGTIIHEMNHVKVCSYCGLKESETCG